MTDLSVIVVSYKGWERLWKCLQSLRFAQADFTFEVIVTDNTPDASEIDGLRSEFSEFTFIHNNVNGGFANGSNYGAARASGRFLLFLNPDTVASPGAISKMLRTAENNSDYSILSCRQVNESGKESRVTGQFPSFRNLTGFMRAFNSRKRYQEISSGSISFPDWVSGSVMMIPKKKFIGLNGFDDDFWMYYEDVDICKRATVSGGRIALLNDVTIEHNHGGSSRTDNDTESLTKTEVLISRHIYISKHKSGAEKIFIQSFLVMNNLVTGLLLAVAGLMVFPHRKGRLRLTMLGRLFRYYSGVLTRSGWLSRRSVNYGKMMVHKP